ELSKAIGLEPAPAPSTQPAASAAPEGVDEFGFAPTAVSFDFGSTPSDEPQADEFGFAPVMIDFGDVIADDNAGSRVIEVNFRPKPELYAKANDALRLLRELGRVGTMEVSCDTSAVPQLTELDPEGAYLSWKLSITGTDEQSVREVFEFVEFDCDLEVVTRVAGMDDESAAATVQAVL